MTSYYKIKELPGLKGMIARGEETAPNHVCVEELINLDVIIGDRQLRFPMPEDALYINTEYLEAIDNIDLREFSTKSPFGKLNYEGHWSKGTIHVDYAHYENALTVNVKDTSVDPVRTVFSDNFYGDYRVDAEECVQRVLKDEDEIEELVFSLSDVADAQRKQTRC